MITLFNFRLTNKKKNDNIIRTTRRGLKLDCTGVTGLMRSPN